MQHFVAKVNKVIDFGEICQLRVSSKVVSNVDFGLFGSGSVLTYY